MFDIGKYSRLRVQYCARHELDIWVARQLYKGDAASGGIQAVLTLPLASHVCARLSMGSLMPELSLARRWVRVRLGAVISNTHIDFWSTSLSVMLWRGAAACVVQGLGESETSVQAVLNGFAWPSVPYTTSTATGLRHCRHQWMAGNWKLSTGQNFGYWCGGLVCFGTLLLYIFFFFFKYSSNLSLVYGLGDYYCTILIIVLSII